MIRKAIIVVLVAGVCLTATGALVGRFYPLGLTLSADESDGTFVGLSAEQGRAMLVVFCMTEHPQTPEQHWVRIVGSSLTSDQLGLAYVIYTLEPVSWVKARVENRCGYPFGESYEYDRTETPGTFHGMHRVVMVGVHFAPMMVFATVTAIAMLIGPARRWRRRRKGQCLTCGYSLEGNVSGVCPECGVKA